MNKWRCSNGQAIFRYDENHKLYINRNDNGFTIKLIEQCSEEKPMLLFRHYLSDKQLGYSKEEDER